jgi:adrenodoxin-NADP+ reductase
MIRNIKKFFSRKEPPISFAVIGTGPGGFYTSKHLLKNYENLHIDLFERLPHPFGLIRTGVAPDHQDVKNVMNDFSQILEDKRVNFYGNINIGKDISFKTLQENYSGIIIAYGADNEYQLEIPNEQVYGSFSGRQFVNWYNGHIEYNKLKFPLDSENCVIIGNGNVAVDLARMLAKSYDDLKKYDIAESVLETLTKNKVNNIHMIGRRGILQGAFTVKEMRELSRVKNLKVYVFENDLNHSLDELFVRMLNLFNPAEKKHAQKKLDLLNSFNVVKDEDDLARKLDKSSKNLIMRFFLAPNSITTSRDNQIVQSVELNKTLLTMNEDKKIVSNVTDQKGAVIQTSLLLKSIGYKSTKLFKEIEFSDTSNTLGNFRGKVYNSDKKLLDNVFTVGWVKTGAKGIIDSTLRDSYGTVETIITSINDNLLKPKIPDMKAVFESADSENVKYINYDQWKKVDRYEVEEGRKKNKIREKIITKEKMLEVALN